MLAALPVAVASAAGLPRAAPRAGALAAPGARARQGRAYHPAAAAPARRGLAPARAAVQTIEASSQAAGSVGVTFTLNRKVDFGQVVLLVGNAPELGNWRLENAPQMTWSEGDEWSVTLPLPAGADIEYKFVLTAPDQPAVWEQCENRRVEVDPYTTGTLACEWDTMDVVASPPAHPADAALSNGKAAAAAALSAAAAALKEKDRAAALAAVQEAAAAAAAVVAAAEATAAAVAKAVQAAESLVSEIDGPSANGAAPGHTHLPALKGPGAPAAAAAAAAATQAAADARYSAEQLEFMRRKLDAIQAMPSAHRNGSASPPAPPPPPRAASPSPAGAQYTPEQLEFLRRSGKSPAPAGASPPPLRRSSSPRPSSRTPSPRPASATVGADTSSFSPEQLEFLRRSGKL